MELNASQRSNTTSADTSVLCDAIRSSFRTFPGAMIPSIPRWPKRNSCRLNRNRCCSDESGEIWLSDTSEGTSVSLISLTGILIFTHATFLAPRCEREIKGERRLLEAPPSVARGGRRTELWDGFWQRSLAPRVLSLANLTSQVWANRAVNLDEPPRNCSPPRGGKWAVESKRAVTSDLKTVSDTQIWKQTHFQLRSVTCGPQSHCCHTFTHFGEKHWFSLRRLNGPQRAGSRVSSSDAPPPALPTNCWNLFFILFWVDTQWWTVSFRFIVYLIIFCYLPRETRWTFCTIWIWRQETIILYCIAMTCNSSRHWFFGYGLFFSLKLLWTEWKEVTVAICPLHRNSNLS